MTGAPSGPPPVPLWQRALATRAEQKGEPVWRRLPKHEGATRAHAFLDARAVCGTVLLREGHGFVAAEHTRFPCTLCLRWLRAHEYKLT